MGGSTLNNRLSVHNRMDSHISGASKFSNNERHCISQKRSNSSISSLGGLSYFRAIREARSVNRSLASANGRGFAPAGSNISI